MITFKDVTVLRRYGVTALRCCGVTAFEYSFQTWIDEICTRIPGVVAIDGKAVCKDPDGKNGVKSKLYMVSAWAARNGIYLGQEKVSEKSNEITAIPELLTELALEGCIVTIDSMGCQKKIAEMIVDAGADYVLAVKDNQKELKESIDFWLNEDNRLHLGQGRRYTTGTGDMSSGSASSWTTPT